MPRFEERFTVQAPPETVWSFLLDPKRLAPCIPGCEDLDIVDERRYAMRLTVKVGFLSTSQAIVMEIVEEDPPRRLVSKGHGEDKLIGSQVDVRTTLELSPDGEGTRVAYTSEVRVLGRLGSIGDAVMKSKASQLAAEFARNVKAALDRDHHPSPPPGERAG